MTARSACSAPTSAASSTCAGAELRNDSGPALAADGLQVGQDMYLSGGFTATGSGGDGAVRLLGAHIGGQLNCAGAELRNDSGPALAADRLQVGQAMFLRGGFTATGSGGLGAVRLLGAHIGGSLDCDGAELRNDSGPALAADGLQVGQDMYLRGGFTATGSGGVGAVRLLGAHIGGSSTAPGRSCATTPAPPWSPTACKSARTCTWAAGSPPPAEAPVWRST